MTQYEVERLIAGKTYTLQMWSTSIDSRTISSKIVRNFTTRKPQYRSLMNTTVFTYWPFEDHQAKGRLTSCRHKSSIHWIVLFMEDKYFNYRHLSREPKKGIIVFLKQKQPRQWPQHHNFFVAVPPTSVQWEAKMQVRSESSNFIKN